MLGGTRHVRRILVAALGTLVFATVLWLQADLLVTEQLNTDQLSALGPQAPTPLLPTPGRDQPLIFIGGVPRSGTTLMRVMLDAHHDVRCGQETRVIPILLDMHRTELGPQEAPLLEEAGVTKVVLDNAMAAFCLQIIMGHGEPAPRICTKDPYILFYASYMHELFPNAKFLFMVRDGRATTHSILSRNITITNYDTSSYRASLKSWNANVWHMYRQCTAVGREHCLAVRYETLVLQPERALRPILRWLGLVWSDNVLHHERYIQQPHGTKLSYVERSTDQVVRPVNVDALDKWVGHFPADVVADMSELAPMLAKLGYDPHANPPDYRALQELDVHANPL